MAAVFEQTYRIRHYECDAYGHVNHANYLRYMQEAAIEASADVGYDETRYQEMRRIWFIRESDITYLRPLVYGDTVVVRTWVQDFRRVRSRRAYELRLAGSDEPVAQATTDWIYVDTETLRPSTISEEMIAAFLPDEGPAEASRRERFPEPTPPPPGIFTIRRPVEWRDIDEGQHVNNANYLAYLEEAGVGVCAAHGWPMNRTMAAGFGIVARRYRIEYRQPAVFGDELEIATWASDVKRATAVRHYTIHRVSNRELLVRAFGLWVWVDLENNRPIRIPADFLADFAPNLSHDGSA